MTSRLRNVAAGQGAQFSDWSQPVSVVTTAQASGSGYAEVVEARLERRDGQTELVVTRPESNWGDGLHRRGPGLPGPWIPTDPGPLAEI